MQPAFLKHPIFHLITADFEYYLSVALNLFMLLFAMDDGKIKHA
jgi:hypothetical protein